MTIKAYGLLFLTNGTPLDTNYTYTTIFNATNENGITQKNPTTCKFELNKGNLIITLDGIEDSEPWKNIQNLCRATVECFLTLHLLRGGYGLMYTLNHYEKSDGTKENFPVDQAIEPKPLEINELAIVTEVTRNMMIREIFRDYNSGLIDRHNLPEFLFREAETITRTLRNLDEGTHVSISKIGSALSEIGVPQPDIDLFKSLAPRLLHPTRHGVHSYFSVEESQQMGHLARHFLTCATKYLIKDSIKSDLTG